MKFSTPLQSPLTGAVLLVAVFLLAPSSQAQSLATSPSASLTSVGYEPIVKPILGDVNGDCVVGFLDLTLVQGAFGSADSDADLNIDGVVDRDDLDVVQAMWGWTCGQRLWGDADGNGWVNVDDQLLVLSNWGTNYPQTDFNGDGTTSEIDLDMLFAQWNRVLGRRLLGDIDGNDVVNVSDLIFLLSTWGTADPRADLNADGSVGPMDRDLLLAQWGETSGTDLLGDVSGDEVVGQRDLDLVVAGWNSAWPRADLDGDGIVGNSDLLIVLARWGDTSATKLIGDVNGDWVVDVVDQDLLLATWGTPFVPADIDGNGDVANADLLAQLANFGQTHGTTNPGDIDGDCEVGQEDIDLLFAVWTTSFVQVDVTADGTASVEDLLVILANFGPTCL